MLRITENPSAPNPAERELFFRVIDREGRIHDTVHRVPPQEPGMRTTLKVDLPGGGAPYVVTAECGCAFVTADGKWGVWQGKLDFVEEKRHVYRLFLDPRDVGNLSRAPYDLEHFLLDSAVVHWSYLLDANMDGRLRLLAPSGRVIAEVWYQGRTPFGGHVSNGSRPLDIGTWTVEQLGDGPATLVLYTHRLMPHAWAAMGIKQPMS